MSIRGGPDIIEDGLVLHLDAAEPLCFRGEPTTNLMPYTNGVAGRVGWPGGAYTHSIETTGEFAGWEKIVATTTGSIADTVMRVGDVSCLANAQYTATMEFYSPYNNLRFNVSGSHGNYIANRIGSSNKYYLNFTIPVNGNQGWWLKTISSTPANTAISNGVIYYRRAQFEQKSYYTDFTIGTRGSTVATGGGLLDLTNNGNNGTITRAASPSAGFYNGNNGGSFVFDGSSDYILCGNNSIFDITQQITLMCWINKTDKTGYHHFLSKFPVSNCSYALYSKPSSGYLSFQFSTNGSNQDPNNISTFSQDVCTGEWTFVCASYNSLTSTVLMAINNNFYSEIESGSIYVSTANLEIGRRSGVGQYWPGKISNVSIYNKALSEDEILQNYNATKGRFGL